MKALLWGACLVSTVASFAWGVEFRVRNLWVGVAHCWALRHQVQIGPDGFVMAGWFLGVCHVDSGREHQPAPGLPGWVDVGVLGCAIVVFCVFVLCLLSVCLASIKGHMVDALASRADEGRWSLR